jgi:hypothetical protein
MASTSPQSSAVDRGAMCSCVTREMQRTMSMQELLELGEKAGPDVEDRERRLMQNDKVRHLVLGCVDELLRKS